jgi:hypothetical protein
MFINNQQMHWFLAVYYFILPLLHVSTRVCHHQGALPCLLSYMRIEMVDKTLRYTLICVCYVEAWCAPICLVTCLLYGGLLCTDLSGYVCYVEAWYAPICLVTCLLYGGLVCTYLSGYVSVMWSPGMHRSVWLRVWYVEAWYAQICLFTSLLCGGLVWPDLSGYVAA